MQQQSSSEDHSKHLIGRDILLRPSAQLELKALLHSVSQLLHQFWLEVGEKVCPYFFNNFVVRGEPATASGDHAFAFL